MTVYPERGAGYTPMAVVIDNPLPGGTTHFILCPRLTTAASSLYSIGT